MVLKVVEWPVQLTTKKREWQVSLPLKKSSHTLHSVIVHLSKLIGHFHDDDIRLQLPEFISLSFSLKKSHLLFTARFKARLNTPTQILFITFFERKLHVLGAEHLLYDCAVYLWNFSDRGKRNKSIYKRKFSVGDEYTERNKQTKDWQKSHLLFYCATKLNKTLTYQ